MDSSNFGRKSKAIGLPKIDENGIKNQIFGQKVRL